ncbi:MAG: alpha/beta hydrolase [Bryobacteraceae bacterium]
MLVRLFLLVVFCAFAHADIRKDIEYAKVGDASLTFDVSVPEGPGPFPTAILVHGGGFVRGDKQMYVPPLFPVLTKANFTWFTINYRLAPQFKFPAATEDLERAIQFVRGHARQYKVDVNRIALIGESAGGQIVSFVGAQNKPASQVAAVVVLYGVHDFISRTVMQGKILDTSQAYLGVKELDAETAPILMKASAVSYIRKGMPPFLLIHGTRDQQVPYEQSVEMCAKMRAAGANCELYTVKEGGHGMGGWDRTPELQGYKPYLIDWLKKILD